VERQLVVHFAGDAPSLEQAAQIRQNRREHGSTSNLRDSPTLKQTTNRERELAPISSFRLESAPTGRCEPVDARLSVVFGCGHFRSQDACGLESVKGWIQGTLTDAQGFASDLANPLLDAPAVIGAEGESFQYQEVERALEILSLGHPYSSRVARGVYQPDQWRVNGKATCNLSPANQGRVGNSRGH
jgi:hypothetical protein